VTPPAPARRQRGSSPPLAREGLAYADSIQETITITIDATMAGFQGGRFGTVGCGIRRTWRLVCWHRTRSAALVRHRRRSVRLRGFDYREDYACLVTICAARRSAAFGEVVDGMIVLTEAGRAAVRCWRAIPDHFAGITLDAYTVQIDHVHGIVVAGALDPMWPRHAVGAVGAVGAQHAVPLPVRSFASFGHVVPRSLSVIIRSYKSAVTREASRPGRALWQRGYHESLLRDAASVDRARRYINAHLTVRPDLG